MSKLLLYIILWVLINLVSVRGEEGRQGKLVEWQIWADNSDSNENVISKLMIVYAN